MKKIIFFKLFIILLCYVSVFSQNIHKELTKLKSNPYYQTTILSDSIIKIEHTLNESQKYLDISDRHINIQELDDEIQIFDLLNIDDSLYTDKYDSIAIYPVGGMSGYPMIIGDFNQNNQLDFAGVYKIEQDYDLGHAAILELQNNGDLLLKYMYEDTIIVPLALTDFDNDNLIELNIRRRQYFYNFENRSHNSFPDSLNLIHQMWQISNAVGSETFIDMDNDNIMDVIYVGDDSIEPSGQKVYVAEYDPYSNIFIKRYSNRPEDWRVSGFSTGDFDGDGFKEFVTGSIHGNVYIFENTGPNTYQMSYEDTITSYNAYLTCTTNDLDNNGKQEFFVGGSSYHFGVSGTWVYWFEATGNDNYTKVRSFFLIGTGVLGTTELYSHDVNNDNKLDLVFAFAEHVVILIWNDLNEEFELFYFNFLNRGYSEIQSVNIHDINDDDRSDLLVSIVDSYYEPRIKTFVYQQNLLSHIKESLPLSNRTFTLYQNNPNPFNKSTKIQFSLKKPSIINLTIYDITGKEVYKLISNQYFKTGTQSIFWNGINNAGKEVSSGIYFYELNANSYSEIKKMLFLK